MNRVVLVDVLRGFALLGLPLTNLAYMADFSNGYIVDKENDVDVFLTFIIDVFVQGRFRTIFCILFGVSMCLYIEKYGHTLFYQKAQARLYALCLIGCVHGVLLWPGDILVNYAVSGLLLIYVIHLDSKTLFKMSVLTIVAPIVLLAYLALIFNEQKTVVMTPQIDGVLAFLYRNLTNFAEMLALLPFLTLWYTFGLMLIGVLIYRSGWLHCGGVSPMYCVFILMPLALVGAIIARWLFFDEHRIVFEVINWLFAIPFCLALISLAAQVPNWIVKKGHLLALAGRYSLSLYLLQSVLGVMAFQIVLQNLQLELRQIHFVAIFVLLTVLQLSLVWWFSRMNVTGPAEMLLIKLQAVIQKRVIK
ncbi:DUF418 domain-containing protein [Pseudoalteromonas sp. SMS1]|uniref:DUF418 domain-containing protein n=1 Tax=Pseudoalteromonas sp. SMS1 TaxID=2908894 RepID=UPI001F270423|nr:DUF418 domain-containing protein [Pseudoalteromonas sp. SMS1]MCF2856021.1 DUF418 domain-containing protein [Pseudoalteromonas sp. SMS1]